MERAGRVTIVTGAGNGLGAAFALACAARGDHVVVNNRSHPDRPSSAAGVVQRIRDAGGNAFAQTSSVEAPGAAQAIVDAALDGFGAIDTLVLNAGICGRAGRAVNLVEADYRAVMEINVFANIALIQAALPHVIAGPAGRIVLISSSAGLYGVRGRSPYSASKGAINAYGLALAAELGKTAVKVNILAPYAETAMTRTAGAPQSDKLLPHHVCPLLLALTDPACAINGQIVVSGGGRARKAAMMESRSFAVATPADVAHNLPAMATMAPIGFRHAEAAFADFYGDLADHFQHTE